MEMIIVSITGLAGGLDVTVFVTMQDTWGMCHKCCLLFFISESGAFSSISQFLFLYANET